jgi:ferritin-like metal-binding protein YciE
MKILTQEQMTQAILNHPELPMGQALLLEQVISCKQDCEARIRDAKKQIARELVEIVDRAGSQKVNTGILAYCLYLTDSKGESDGNGSQ